MGTGRWRILTAVLFSVAAAIAYARHCTVWEVHAPAPSPIATVADPAPADDDWPCWRGANKANCVDAAEPHLAWTSSSDILWKTSIPGRGHSSPIVWQNQVFLTSADPTDESVTLLCLDRNSGRMNWQTELHRGGFMAVHAKNSQASATAACDGRYVYVPIAIANQLQVWAVDLQGKIVWQQQAGSYNNADGFGSSIALYQCLAIVAGDNSGQGVAKLVGSSYLAALDKRTGQIVWRVKRPQADSHGTPIVVQLAGRTQLLLPGKHAVTSYEPSDGSELWTCQWSAIRPANTVAFDDQHVFAVAKYPKPEIVCIRADGHGDVTETNVVWRIATSAGDVPSPLIHDGRLYSISDNGVLSCLKTTSGELLWKRRLAGNFSSSPLVAGQYLYCCNEEGTTFVFRLGAEPDQISENVLEEGMSASPILVGEKLLLRTTTAIYCIKTRDPISSPEKTIAAQPSDISSSKR